MRKAPVCPNCGEEGRIVERLFQHTDIRWLSLDAGSGEIIESDPEFNDNNGTATICTKCGEETTEDDVWERTFH